MVEFAKSIFGFYKKEGEQGAGPQGSGTTGGYQNVPDSSIGVGNDPNSAQPLAQPLHNDQQLHRLPTPDELGGGGQKQLHRFYPSSAVPTTALLDNSQVYGTTTTKVENSDFSGLEPAQKLQQLQQQQPHGQQGVTFLGNQGNFSGPGSGQHPKHHIENSHVEPLLPPGAPQQQFLQFQTTTNAPLSEDPSARLSDSSTNPIIITTDETGQNYKLDSQKSAQPKGKLKVLILEARGLLINLDLSQPYVVCTFESSEFVTNASGLYNSHGKNLPYGVPVKKKGGRSGLRPSLYQRQSSTQHINTNVGLSNPVWSHEATFDVVGLKSELDISIYDAGADDCFLGHVRVYPATTLTSGSVLLGPQWLELKSRVIGERIEGSIRLQWEYTVADAKKLFGPDDFEVLRLLGKGTFGQVFQVKKRDTGRIYAMKVLLKKVIVKKKEIAHTIGERNILVRTSAAASPFIVGLKFSFQTPTDLYLVTDYMSGGELFWHLQKEGRFSEDRAKFYIAELILALEHLHDNSIVYRDLKPENILLDANGHIALCDFGLSKANLNNDGTTNTFCGTTEYLAPEVLLDESGYTKMVDFWLLGVLIFEMCCGWSPFYADNTQQMYKNIAFGKVRFPKEVLSPEGRSFVKGLLNRNPKHRLGLQNDARELKAHPFFADIDWALLRLKNIPPPFKPHLSLETDTLNFDPEFTNELTSVLKRNMELASTPLLPGIQANFKGFTYVDDLTIEDQFGKSVHKFRNPGSLVLQDTNLPPDEDAIEDDRIDEDDEMQIEMEEDEFVNGRFDL